MTVRVRTGCLNGFSELIEELHGDAEKLITSVGIDYTRVKDENYFFPYLQFMELLELVATNLNCPDIGLKLALKQDQAILGPVAFLALSASDVRTALISVGQFLYHFTPAISLSLDEADHKQSYVCLDLSYLDIADCRQAVEHAVACTYHISHLITNDHVKARAVHFRHARMADQDTYEAIFHCPVKFNQARDAVVIDTDFLDFQLSSHNAQLHGLVSNYLSMVETEHNATTQANILPSKQARHLIKKLLPTGQLSRKIIAEKMNLHERALHRKLQVDGYTFEALVDEVRTAEVKNLLSQGSIPMSQIAGLLGYSEQSSFNRAFKRWFNMTPKQYLLEKSH